MRKQRKAIEHLPPQMGEAAVIARKLACKDPSCVKVDDEFLPWVFHKESGYWVSFDGNYSSLSPDEKRKKDAEYQALREEGQKYAVEDFRKLHFWSLVRQHVLERDKRTCQMCGKYAHSNLHVHHILKRKEGGGEFFDNLVTLCPSCHPKADTKFYNPDWTELPKEITDHGMA